MSSEKLANPSNYVPAADHLVVLHCSCPLLDESEIFCSFEQPVCMELADGRSAAVVLASLLKLHA